ncbi:hypothetical protein XELAEV_18047737mg [Xenopus laevis]|uniref:PDZ domain-containing protein n=1 Tax=Xenopus laevis TaxID=8355 RepID=A0A974BVG7_XENLA|nr:hypothetical protein XELAEV_18047737mg [Xenopus laevis]
MPVTNEGWPETFGFGVGGSGPCYILWVEAGSSAHTAGLQPGDQILEVEGMPVSSLSCDSLTRLGRECHKVPPSIGVISRVQQVELAGGNQEELGLTITSGRPLQVGSVTSGSLAFNAGVRTGDFLLQVNGIPVTDLTEVTQLLTSCDWDTLHLGLLCVGQRQRHSRAFSAGGKGIENTCQVHKLRAQEFNRKLDEILGDQSALKEKVFSLLRQYAQDRKVDTLAYSLSMILTQEPHHLLIDNIRYQTNYT